MSEYSRQEIAKRAGVDPDYVDRLVEFGILTPDAEDTFSPGDVLRARWVQSLEQAGVPLDGMAAAVRDGVLSFSFMDKTAYDRFAGLAGMTFHELSARIWYPSKPPDGGPRGLRPRGATARGHRPRGRAVGRAGDRASARNGVPPRSH